MTAREELRAINKRINQRLVRLEQKGLEGYKVYEETIQQIKESGFATVSKTGKIRLKESVKGIREEDITKALSTSKKLSTRGLGTAKAKVYGDIESKFKSRFGAVSKKDVADFLELQRFSSYREMSKFLASEQLYEFTQKKFREGFSASDIDKLFDEYQNAKKGTMFDASDFLKWLQTQKKV